MLADLFVKDVIANNAYIVKCLYQLVYDSSDMPTPVVAIVRG